MDMNEISASDRALIEQLREAIRDELLLMPAYDDDFSLLRWITGWDREIDLIVPKIKHSLRTLSALGLGKKNFSTLEEIQTYCDSLSEPLQYLPGSILGYDKENNVVTIQTVGQVDVRGVLQSVRCSDFYIMRISESEGVMSLIRKNEKIMGHQLGSVMIFDLEGFSIGLLWSPGIKSVTMVLQELQELFPDAVRKLFFVNTPIFFRLLWTLVSPYVTKHTEQKIKILGSDWKEKLKEDIGEDVLYPNWGGVRKAETPYGHIRMGGKVPDKLRYDSSNDIPESKLKKIKIPAGSSHFVPVVVEGYSQSRKLSWWWRIENGDVDFSVVRSGDPVNSGGVDTHDVVIWPKFRLMTLWVPESGKVSCATPGTYKLVFDNSYSRFYNKVIRYHLDILDD